MNPDQQRALMGLNLAVAAMKVGSDVRGSKAAAEKTAASNKEQLAEMRKQGDAAAKRDAERNQILQQQTDAVLKEEQKRTKLLEDQIADPKKAKEQEEALKRDKERTAKVGKEYVENIKKAEKPEAKAFAYFLTRSALQGRDELTGEQREKLVGQLRIATSLQESSICDQKFILEHLVRPASFLCLEEEGREDKIFSLIEGTPLKYSLVQWLAKLQEILTGEEGIGDREQEWIGSIKRHYEISDMAVAEALTGVRKKVEERFVPAVPEAG